MTITESTGDQGDKVLGGGVELGERGPWWW